MRSKPSGGAGPSTSAFSAHGFVSGVIAGGTGVFVGHGFDTLKVRRRSGAADVLSVAVLYRHPAAADHDGAARALLRHLREREAHARARRGGGRALAAVGRRRGGGHRPLTAPVTSPFVTLAAAAGQRRQRRAGDPRRRQAGGFCGFGVHGTLETIGSCVYLVTYVVAKRAGRQRRCGGAADGSGPRREPTAAVVRGALAGMTAWTAIYPVDVLRLIMSQPAGGGSAARRPRVLRRRRSARLLARDRHDAAARRARRGASPVNDMLLDYLRTVF